MLNVAPQKERIPDHLRAMAEQDDKSAASGKTGEQSTIGVGCAPGEERDSATRRPFYFLLGRLPLPPSRQPGGELTAMLWLRGFYRLVCYS